MNKNSGRKSTSNLLNDRTTKAATTTVTKEVEEEELKVIFR